MDTDRLLDVRAFDLDAAEELPRTEYIDEIEQAADPGHVLRLVNEFMTGLHRDGTLPEPPLPAASVPMLTLDDAYRWLGMVAAKIQRHAPRLPADILVAIHVVLDTAFCRFKALGLK